MNIETDFINEDNSSLELVRPSYNPFQILRSADAVTPNDSAELSHYGILYVGTGGAVKVDVAGNGTTMTFILESGEFLPVLVKRVYSTDTDATSIYVMY